MNSRRKITHYWLGNSLFSFPLSHFPNSLLLSIMGNLLYIIAVILIILWAVGYFGMHVGGGLIHILLVIAIIAVLLRVIRGGSAV